MRKALPSCLAAAELRGQAAEYAAACCCSRRGEPCMRSCPAACCGRRCSWEEGRLHLHLHGRRAALLVENHRLLLKRHLQAEHSLVRQTAQQQHKAGAAGERQRQVQADQAGVTEEGAQPALWSRCTHPSARSTALQRRSRGVPCPRACLQVADLAAQHLERGQHNVLWPQHPRAFHLENKGVLGWERRRRA